MKKFFAMFGICFGALVVFLGVYLGICYLKGDFDEKKVYPKDIVFEQKNYYVSENFEAVILANTLTPEEEGVETPEVNQTEISLSFNSLYKNCKMPLNVTLSNISR